jgi:hypothetical protein
MQILVKKKGSPKFQQGHMLQVGKNFIIPVFFIHPVFIETQRVWNKCSIAFIFSGKIELLSALPANANPAKFPGTSS